MAQSGRAVRFPPSSSLKIFEVQSAGDGGGIYNCLEQVLDAEQWGEPGGKSKFNDKNATEIEVLNLAEAGLAAGCAAILSIGDLLFAWETIDSTGTKRWTGLLSGAFGRHFGVITRAVSRGNVLEGIDPESAYYVKMQAGKTENWNKSGIDYVKGDIVQYNGDIWDCTKEHTSHIARAPMEGSAFWKVHSDIRMTVLHFKNGYLPDTIPYFRVGDIVEVLQYAGKWYISATVTNCVKNTFSLSWTADFGGGPIDLAELIRLLNEGKISIDDLLDLIESGKVKIEKSSKYSLIWDEDEQRAKAVFA